MTNRSKALLGAIAVLVILGGQAARAQDVAYAMVLNDALVSAFNPSGQPMSATSGGPGVYTINFTGSSIGTGWNVEVQAFGADLAFCNVVDFWTVTGSVKVNCFTGAGVPANHNFTLQAYGPKNLQNVSYVTGNFDGTWTPPRPAFPRTSRLNPRCEPSYWK